MKKQNKRERMGYRTINQRNCCGNCEYFEWDESDGNQRNKRCRIGGFPVAKTSDCDFHSESNSGQGSWDECTDQEKEDERTVREKEDDYIDL